MRYGLFFAALAACFSMLAAPASAQATRTWVSGVGDDVNPCSRTAPCKTFAGAISKTAAGGEISILDPAGYGAVTITKSISIVAEGAEGSILAAGTNGIVVNAQPGDAITLYGLFIEGGATGINGIRIIGGGEIVIRNCLIRGFQADASSAGIRIEPAGKTRVLVSNTMLTKNSAGIVVKPAAAPAGADVFLDRVQATQNTGAGVTADGATALVRLSGSTVFGNASGLASANSGQILSFGNNALAGNGQDGAPTGAAALK